MWMIVFLLNALTIYAPNEYVPVGGNQHYPNIHTHHQQTGRPILYELYIPVGYSVVPFEIYNQYMSIQPPSYQQIFDVPIYSDPLPRPNIFSHTLPNHAEMININMQQHRPHVHSQQTMTLPIPQNLLLGHVQDMSLFIPPYMHRVHQHISQNPLFVHQQPVVDHSINQALQPVQYHHIRHSENLPVHTTQNSIPEHPTLVHTMDEQQQSVVQENIALLEEENNSKLQDVSMNDHPELSQNPKDQIFANNRDSAHQDNVETDEILTTTVTVNKLEDNLSVENQIQNVDQRYQIPDYDEVVQRMFEIAKVANIVAFHPKRKINFKSKWTRKIISFYLCILNNAKKNGWHINQTAAICCKIYYKSVIRKIDLNEFCMKFNELFTSIPLRIKGKLIDIYPNSILPHVKDWVIEDDE